MPFRRPLVTPARRRRLAAAAALALAAPLALGAAPAGAEATSYVALGDSYSSGLGTRSYLADGTDCRRSASAFPAQLAAGQGYDLDFRACAGARVPDVRAAQLGALSASTGLVTISVGGNDAGFADVLTECALPAWASNCDRAVDGAQAYVAGTLPGVLAGLYGEIRAAAPAAQVVVVGYPRIFMGEDCNALTWFSPAEQTRLNQTADQLNGVLRQAASAAGFSFADPTAAFVGHAVCDSPEWINGLSNPIQESYHPNVAGQVSGYTPVVAGAAGVLTASSVDTQAAAEAAAPGWAREQRAYADLDRTIRVRTVTAPDLDSPRVRAAARAYGVDLADRASIDRVDRRVAREQAAAHRATGD